eukprot:TRINITY_DN8402_c0_g1_i1.p1 TRINITY_DN8402_c0_g1~~TRINITY_DN8402_c0_g1_i1.p1  ORF type:complete len:655 (-),score=104.01 TRINITY_DN8402_c0_g1_i1:50-2014(-)
MNNENTGLLVNDNSEQPRKSSNWEFAGYGSVSRIYDVWDPSGVDNTYTPRHRMTEDEKLNQVFATAISGNDITSSCLYVVPLCLASANFFAPISLLMVVIVLYLFRNVYAEVGSALPLNGGAYNILLNTTTKFIASLAACLTVLSYVATAVVSASEAMSYAQKLSTYINPHWATVALLGLFALLNLAGISESSKVALLIFVFHLSTLLILISYCVYHLAKQGSNVYFIENWKYTMSNVTTSSLTDMDFSLGAVAKKTIPGLIFYGFCSGLLGVSGFETSANFIEEQKKGVFPKTLRNMWFAVAFINPTVCTLALGVLPLNAIVSDQATLLARMGLVSGGKWLELLVSIDAAIVLSGAVLTSYVGIIGLVHRMSLDRILPNFLMVKNSCRRTSHFIIIGFFAITSSLYLMVVFSSPHQSDSLSKLAGVYTISFLSVMALFAVGNIILKYKRSEIPREIKANPVAVFLALVSSVAALIGNIIFNESMVRYFLFYFSITFLIIFMMLFRIRFLRIICGMLQKSFLNKYLGEWIRRQIEEIRNIQMVFFTRSGDLTVLNKAILYVKNNELTNHLKIVHCYDEEEQIPPTLQANVEYLDELYPKMRIDLVLVHGQFSPNFVEYISHKTGVELNFMFIACPGNEFRHDIGDFGGVRLITH